MTYSEATESECLTDIYEDGEDLHIGDSYYFFNTIKKRIEKLNNNYNIASKKKLGEIMNCAYCGKELIKTQYSQKFCPPIKITMNKKLGKVKKIYKCKDRFHNSVDITRWKKGNYIQ